MHHFIEGADVKLKTIDGFTALHVGASNGRVEVVKILIDSGELVSIVYTLAFTMKFLADSLPHAKGPFKENYWGKVSNALFFS